MFLDQFLFELSCKNTETHTHKDAHKDSYEYSRLRLTKTKKSIKTIVMQNTRVSE